VPEDPVSDPVEALLEDVDELAERRLVARAEGPGESVRSRRLEGVLGRLRAATVLGGAAVAHGVLAGWTREEAPGSAPRVSRSPSRSGRARGARRAPP